jgi:hypothetical protein
LIALRRCVWRLRLVLGGALLNAASHVLPPGVGRVVLVEVLRRQAGKDPRAIADLLAEMGAP